jgi:hypothetical protein
VTPSEPADEAKPRTAAKPPKVAKKKRGKKANKDVATKQADDDGVDACAPICGPADAICDLSARICGLAEEHEEESRYVEACERAEADCERAAEACEECRD